MEKRKKKISVFFITKQKKEMGKKMNNEREKRENVYRWREWSIYQKNHQFVLEEFCNDVEDLRIHHQVFPNRFLKTKRTKIVKKKRKRKKRKENHKRSWMFFTRVSSTMACILPIISSDRVLGAAGLGEAEVDLRKSQ